MKLSPIQLIQKFPQLKRFENQKWLSEECIKEDCNYKEIPLLACFEMIKMTIEFIEKTKFNGHWEEGFSVKHRLFQMRDLLSYFCEDTIEEKTVKGDNLNPPTPIH
jgi:hypothetical protein